MNLLKNPTTTSLSIVFLVGLFKHVFCMEVSVDYDASLFSYQSSPNEFSVKINTLQGETLIDKLTLLRVEDFFERTPVFILKNDKTIKKEEHNPEHVDVSIYTNVKRGAMFQIKRNKVTGNIELSGEIFYKGNTYHLRFKQRRKRSSTYHEDLFEMEKTETVTFTHDAIEPTPEKEVILTETLLHSLPSIFNVKNTVNKITNNRPNNPLLPKSREKRQTGNYIIDLVAVADYAVFRRHQQQYSTKAEAVASIREYYSYIFHGVDLRYQNIGSPNIRVRLVKILIPESPAAAPFTELYRVQDRRWDDVDATKALTRFKTYVGEEQADVMKPYDHVMLFTGYDLTSEINGETLNSTTGLAYTGTLCRTDGTSVSIVEDLGGFQAVDTAAHELGHSLSAKHDGDNNLCRTEDRFIMASGSFKSNSENLRNPWKFSSCSVDYFKNFIQNNVARARYQQCLLGVFNISESVPDLSEQEYLPGQQFSPDQQCQQIYGSSSRLCRGMEVTDIQHETTICTSMFCYDPSTVGTCYEQTAARGTGCGDGKMCLNGACVADPRAARLDETCLYGDQPGLAFDEKTCPEFVDDFPGFCYQTTPVYDRCCKSCKSHQLLIQNCTYGDKAKGCNVDACDVASDSYKQQCCETCDFGEKITTTDKTPTTSSTTASSQSTTSSTSTEEPSCKDNPKVFVEDAYNCAAIAVHRKSLCFDETYKILCCESCSKVEETECVDDPKKEVNNLNCFSAVRLNNSLCYSNVRESCCASCERFKTDTKSCPYGDRDTVRCRYANACVGSDAQDVCCKTCTSGATIIYINVSVTLITFILFVFQLHGLS